MRHPFPATIQVGIPWRATPDRIFAFEHTSRWYAEHGFQVVAGDESTPKHHFSPAAARNNLVRELMEPADVYILSDADTMPEYEPLVEAIQEVLAGSPYLHLPYHLYRRDGPSNPREPEFVFGASSGVLVFGPNVWVTLNGQDEYFRGWGYEDTAFKLAHETLIGPIQRHVGTVLSMRHALADRGRLQMNRLRYQQYLQAYGDPAKMRALVGNARPLFVRDPDECQEEEA